MKSKFVVLLLTTVSLYSFCRVAVVYYNRHKGLGAVHAQAKAGALMPVRLIITDLDIDVPIFESEIFEGEWEAFDEGISYLKTSPLPGAKGNSILYGHNWPNLLQNLNNIQVGMEIQVVFNDSQVRVFEFQDKFSITADQTHVLTNSEYSKLTIYTCDGFLDSKRFVVTAVPI
jgi:LPXTG-site transpeptidase (sortase) family protein